MYVCIWQKLKAVDRATAMNNWHTNAGFAIFVVFASALVLFLLALSYHRHPLLPAANSQFPYTVFPSTDVVDGGTSRIVLNNTEKQLDYTYHLSDGYQYPYTSMTMGFGDELVDWSHYSTLELTVACSPANILMFTVHTFDAEVTDPSNYLSYRRARTTFSCSPIPQRVTIDLKKLTAPKWWLMSFDLPLTQRDYDLSKVFEVAVENSSQSPLYTDSQVQVTRAILVGRNWACSAPAAIIAGLLCLVIIGWYLKQHSIKLRKELRQKLEQESIASSYQPISATCKSDRERNAVLDFMATQYANPELNQELATRLLGINRVKINDILREQQGLTFSTYLKKIRLTEAARLLREKQAGVAEIVFMVGYNNAPYFNRIFKKEFGCTPSAYKRAMSNSISPEPPES